VADYILSRRARQDLVEIYTFSYERFGETKADAYLLALRERLQLLAEQPHLGKRVDVRKQHL
jgi:plasmid stabilization system protein ParE